MKVIKFYKAMRFCAIFFLQFGFVFYFFRGGERRSGILNLYPPLFQLFFIEKFYFLLSQWVKGSFFLQSDSSSFLSYGGERRSGILNLYPPFFNFFLSKKRDF